VFDDRIGRCSEPFKTTRKQMAYKIPQHKWTGDSFNHGRFFIAVSVIVIDRL
jgi:hypothetical protein